jgi:hypothetical protein
MIAEHVINYMEGEMERHLDYAAERIRLRHYDQAWPLIAIALSCKDALEIMRKHNADCQAFNDAPASPRER